MISCRTGDRSCPALQLLIFFFLKVGGFFSGCAIFGTKNLHDIVITSSTHKNESSHAEETTSATQITDENPLHKNGNTFSLFALQLELFTCRIPVTIPV